jgi:Protein of unknown function (DUF3761)
MYITPAVRTLVVFFFVGFASTTAAQIPTGATGICKDGSYSEAGSKKGACARHGGVREWYSDRGPTEKTATTPAVRESTKAAPSATPSSPTRPAETAAAGGGPGQVWVNTRSKVYHCQGDKWYGKTIKGEYMTEAAAKAAGSHADHGKSCQ